MNIPAADQQYVTGVREIVAGILLVALTLTLHAVGMLLTFAWSTGLLLTVAQDFQDRHLSAAKPRRGQREAKPVAAPVDAVEVSN